MYHHVSKSSEAKQAFEKDTLSMNEEMRANRMEANGKYNKIV